MRRVFVMSRREVEGVWPDEVRRPAAVISITDPRSSDARVPSPVVSVLRLSFDDVDPESVERQAPLIREKYGADEERTFRENYAGMAPCSETHARSIVAYVKSLGDDVDLVVHCEAGISRSAGVAAALDAMNVATWHTLAHRHRPNAWVKQLIVRALAPRRGKGKR